MTDLEALRTPCYILNEEEYRQSIRTFRQSFETAWGGECEFGYSVKTNHLPWPLTIAREEGFRTEVVSADEYAYARGLGIPAREIILNGPNKGAALAEALGSGGLVNLDSLAECARTAEAAKRGEISPETRIGLRVNFDLEARCPGETTAGGEGSRFGLCAENGDLARGAETLASAGIRIQGLHMHQSSGTRSLRVFQALAEKALELAREMEMRDMAFLDMGGGYFGGSYFPGKPSIPQYAETICDTLRAGLDPAKTTLILEPGAGILATAMDYLTSAVNLREIRGKRIVTLDGTMLHINPFMHPHPVPFTMIHPGDKMEAGERERWIVAGSTCMEMDRIEPRGMDHRPREDTRFLFHCCGAYMATHNSNFINAAPAIYRKAGGEYTLMRAPDPMKMAEI